jgi:hypothetical protein
MTASRDPERLIRAFLNEGPIELPDRTYDAVRSRLDRTRQRVVIGPWREPRMSNLMRLAIAAAAVVVVAVVGINLLPGGGGVGGPAVSPSPSPTIAPTPTVAPTVVVVIPPAGELTIGRHDMTLNSVPFTFEVSRIGWISNGSFGFDRTEGIGPDGAGFILWGEAPVGVFADPCSQTRGPVIGTSAANLAAAVASVPGTDLVSGPTDVTVGGRPAKLVVVGIPDVIGCAASDFYLWWGPSVDNARYATRPGSTIRAWIIDVDGAIVWIDGETYAGAGPEPVQELQEIVDSIQFE